MLLGMRPDVEVVASVENGNDVVQLCREHEPDVVVMDYRLPGMDGVEATTAVLDACPRARVVCLTASASPTELAAFERAGAVECLLKEQALDEIVGAIRRAANTRGET